MSLQSRAEHQRLRRCQPYLELQSEHVPGQGRYKQRSFLVSGGGPTVISAGPRDLDSITPRRPHPRHREGTAWYPASATHGDSLGSTRWFPRFGELGHRGRSIGVCPWLPESRARRRTLLGRRGLGHRHPPTEMCERWRCLPPGYPMTADSPPTPELGWSQANLAVVHDNAQTQLHLALGSRPVPVFVMGGSTLRASGGLVGGLAEWEHRRRRCE